MHTRVLWSTFWTKISVFEWLEFPLIIYNISLIYIKITCNTLHTKIENWQKAGNTLLSCIWITFHYIPHLVHRVSNTSLFSPQKLYDSNLFCHFSHNFHFFCQIFSFFSNEGMIYRSGFKHELRKNKKFEYWVECHFSSPKWKTLFKWHEKSEWIDKGVNGLVQGLMDWERSEWTVSGVNGFDVGVNGLGQELIVWIRSEWIGSLVNRLRKK